MPPRDLRTIFAHDPEPSERPVPPGAFDVLNWAAADTEHAGRVYVLPMPCGTGKSTAISMMMRQGIEAWESGESQDGLLVMADNNDQVQRYMEPWDEELKGWLHAHRDQIVIMNKDNRDEVMPQIPYKPVLRITTQRYFLPSWDAIVDKYLLLHNGGRRTLAIIDEMPPVHSTVQLGIKELNDIDTAFKTCPGDDEEKAWCISQWQAFREMLEADMADMVQGMDAKRFSRYYVRLTADPETGERKQHRCITDSDSDDVRLFDYVREHRDVFGKQASENESTPYEMLIGFKSLMQYGGVFAYRDETDY